MGVGLEPLVVGGQKGTGEGLCKVGLVGVGLGRLRLGGQWGRPPRVTKGVLKSRFRGTQRYNREVMYAFGFLVRGDSYWRWPVHGQRLGRFLL